MKKKKAFLLVACAVLLVVASVMGTMAYLTDSASVTNTFTVGKVDIKLDESTVNEYGEHTNPAGRAEAGNSYKLIPGHEYVKDPIVTVLAGSEASWLFVKVENEISAIEATTNTIAAQITANGWNALEGVNGVYYKEASATSNNDAQYKVFEKFTIADDAVTTDYASKTVKITAYAIQKDGFTTAAAAWTEVSK